MRVFWGGVRSWDTLLCYVPYMFEGWKGPGRWICCYEWFRGSRGRLRPRLAAFEKREVVFCLRIVVEAG